MPWIMDYPKRSGFLSLAFTTNVVSMAFQLSKRTPLRKSLKQTLTKVLRLRQNKKETMISINLSTTHQFGMKISEIFVPILILAL